MERTCVKAVKYEQIIYVDAHMRESSAQTNPTDHIPPSILICIYKRVKIPSFYIVWNDDTKFFL